MIKNYRIAQNFSGIGTARKLVEKMLAFGRGKAHSILELTRSHNVLADKTLADWQYTAKSTKVFSRQSFVLYGMHLSTYSTI